MLLGMLVAGPFATLISKAKLFRSISMGGLLGYYLFILNEKILNATGSKIPSH